MKQAVILTGMMPTAALAAGLFFGTPAVAQVDLTFGVGIRAESDSNPGLTPVSSGQTSSIGLNLSFGLVSETASSSLTLNGSAGLTAASGTGSSGLTSPTLALAYTQTTAAADFTLNGSVSAVDLATTRDVNDFVIGTGSRRTANLATSITWGKTAPLGFGLNAAITDVSYYNSPGPGLIASQTLLVGANARADLSPVLRFDLGLSDSRFTQPGLPSRDTIGLDAGLTLQRPQGELALHLAASDTPDGQRQTLRFDQRIDLAAGTLSYSLGATRGVTDTTRVIGSLDYAQDLAQGALTLGLRRTVGASAVTDAETVQSSAALGYNHAVTPRATLALALNWAEQVDSATNLATANTSLAATWTQALPQDWALDLGLTHRLRDQDGVGTGRSDSVFLELRRDFSIRY